MSNGVAIRAENLGKKYLIRHEKAERYTTLRDLIANSWRAPWRSLASWLQRAQARAGNGRSPCSFSAVYASKSAPNGDSALDCQRISSPPRQEEFWALRDVSFAIQRGEVVGIIGRNGAGKSTLLKILSRITEPTTGEIEIEGRVASLLEVATGFHPELTGRENVFLNGAILGMTRVEIKKKFDEIVAFADVERFLDTPVKRYSSGMYVRLAFAVAAHLEPDILIVDEVLAVGDAEFQRKCLGKMRDVATCGRTILFVSHNMTALRSLCERGIVLDAGRKRCEGAIVDVVKYYTASAADLGIKSWVRATNATNEKMAFESISGELEGEQPHLMLRCNITLRCLENCAPSFVAADICDVTMTHLMQALPSAEPFIEGSQGLHRLQLEIDLPPLIPGLYNVHFWIGAHFTTTFDYVPRAIGFEITQSPSRNRSFPHSSECGFIVPHSRYKYTMDQVLKVRASKQTAFTSP